MSADAVATIDERDPDVVGVVDQGVGECHSHGAAGPHHEVIDVDRAGHGTTQAPRRRLVYGFND